MSAWMPRLHTLLSRWRYLQFGLVGASGTVVNLAVLYLCQEVLLQGIDATERLYTSLALAIALATVNNFFWNRVWTWRDRQVGPDTTARMLRQFLRYALASWLGTSVQYVLTLWLATQMHYMLGNVLAIVLASVVNYFANDWWTFQPQPRQVSWQEWQRRYERVTLMVLLLAVGVYAFDLGGENIPRNGDELVYAHIAFKTWWQVLHGGGWLPLASDLGHMRNTKPPLLFWQAMAMGGHLEWKLLWLRLPSLLYTLATTACVVWAARTLGSRLRDPAQSAHRFNARTLGYVAGLFYLAFFSTYRYGRPYLTSAIETFWMGLPCWWLLALQLRHAGGHTAAAQRAPATQGLFAVAAIGFGMVAGHKSFVLIAPMAASLFVALCWWQPLAWRRWLWGSTWCTLAGCAFFALWFVLDPNPEAVWREFVVGENVGKMAQGGPSYWQTALIGGYSVWWQALAIPQNALLLAPIVLAVLWQGLRAARPTWQRHWPALQGRAAALAEPSATLWWYVLVVSVFFLLPSQRSSRYLIPLMPMVAVLCALHLARLPLWAHRVTLGASTLLSVGVLGLLGLFLWAGWRVALYPLWGRLGLLLILVVQVLALLRLLVSVLGSVRAPHAAPRLLTGWVWLLGLVISLYAWFGMLSAPLHTASNQYSEAVRARLAQGRVAVPSYFNGDFERWRFLLDTRTQLTPYDAPALQQAPTAEAQHALLRAWLAGYDAVVVHGHWDAPPPDCAHLGCEVLAQRIALRGRHRSDEINATSVRVPEQLFFWREYLLVPAGAAR